MKKSVTNTTLGLIALATMSFAASHAQANPDTPQHFAPHYGQSWQDWDDGPRYGQHVYQPRQINMYARQAQPHNRIGQDTQYGSLNRHEYRTPITHTSNYNYSRYGDHRGNNGKSSYQH